MHILMSNITHTDTKSRVKYLLKIKLHFILFNQKINKLIFMRNKITRQLYVTCHVYFTLTYNNQLLTLKQMLLLTKELIYSFN